MKKFPLVGNEETCFRPFTLLVAEIGISLISHKFGNLLALPLFYNVNFLTGKTSFRVLIKITAKEGIITRSHQIISPPTMYLNLILVLFSLDLFFGFSSSDVKEFLRGKQRRKFSNEDTMKTGLKLGKPYCKIPKIRPTAVLFPNRTLLLLSGSFLKPDFIWNFSCF